MKIVSPRVFLVLGICAGPIWSMSMDQPNALKLRGAAFIPQSGLFRTMYGTAVGNVELEYVRYMREQVSLWLNINGLFARGSSLGLCNPTKIGMGSVSFGFDFPWRVSECSTAYLGLGPSFAGVHLTNNSVCGCEKVTAGAAGIVFKSGWDIKLGTHLVLEFFADYLVQYAFFTRRVDVSGLRLGGALGVSF